MVGAEVALLLYFIATPSTEPSPCVLLGTARSHQDKVASSTNHRFFPSCDSTSSHPQIEPLNLPLYFTSRSFPSSPDFSLPGRCAVLAFCSSLSFSASCCLDSRYFLNRKPWVFNQEIWCFTRQRNHIVNGGVLSTACCSLKKNETI